MDERLIPVKETTDIPEQYLGTPIETLLRSHNLGEMFESPENPQLLVSLCMDHRKSLQIPKDFAYIIRNAGAYIEDAGFMISYALSVGGVKTIAVIGHNHCGMRAVSNKGTEFMQGLEKEHGWKHEDALVHYKMGVEKYAIADEIDSVHKMTKSLETHYDNLLVAPMMYLLEDNNLYLIK